MGNDSSKAAASALRDDSDFQEVSLPSSSPRGSPVQSHNSNDLSYSGVLVERPVVMALDGTGRVDGAVTPIPVSKKTSGGGGTGTSSNVSKRTGGGSHKKVSSATEIAGRRIVKATPPASGDVAGTATAAATTQPTKGNVDDDDADGRALSSPAGSSLSMAAHKKQHLPPVLLPKADSELLEESIEQSRNRRLEKLSKTQKSKRDKAIEDKRRKTKPANSDAAAAVATPQPNPFSKFLSAFSVKATHPKRAYEVGESDKEEEKVGEPVAAGTADAVSSVSKRPKLETEGAGSTGASGVTTKRATTADDSTHITDSPLSIISTLMESLPEWVPLAAGAGGMAIVAVLLALRLSRMGGASS